METKVTGHDNDAMSQSSSTSPHEKSSLQTEKDVDLRYGCFGCKPRWLQRLNTVGGFVAWLSLANCFQSTANGLIGVVLSTLESRFDFSSSQSSWIASAYEMGPIPVLIFISYFGNRIHRPLSCAIGLLSVMVGCILFFIPQFTTPSYRPTDTGEESNMCFPYSNRTSGCNPDEEDLSSYLPLFIVARLLIGAGSTPILTLGVTYMDDCSERGKFATYAGIFNAMSVVGPAVAFVGGGVMLSLYVDFYKVDPADLGLSPNDSAWIGAWWLPYTIAAGLSLLNAIPMFGYPEDLPGAADIRRAKVTEAHNDDADVDQNQAQIAYIKSWGEFKKLFKSVLTNPTFLCLSVFNSADCFIIAGFTAFGPKLFEVSFTLTAGAAGAIFGVVLLPAGAGGTILGGVLIMKLKMSCRQIIRLQTILCAIVTAGICLLLITCNPIDFAGVNTHYNANLSSSTFNLTDSCNVDCQCQYVDYNPICSHDNVMYFSPCHAGCSLMDDGDTQYYYNCSCISTPPNGAVLHASSEPCSADSCPVAIFFLIVFFFAVVFIFICLTLNMAASLRVVTSSQTSFAIGIQVLCIKCLGMIPGPIFLGMAFDNSCILWQYDSCGERGNCLVYDNKVLAVYIFVIIFTVKVISLVSSVVAIITYKPPAPAKVLVEEVSAHSSNQIHPLEYGTEHPHEPLKYDENGNENLPRSVEAEEHSRHDYEMDDTTHL